MELGTWGEWFGGVLGVAVSVASLLIAINAQRTANDNEKERLAWEEEHRKQDKKRQDERDARSVAGSIQAWWAIDEESDGSQRWGIVLQNASSDRVSVTNVKLCGERPLNKQRRSTESCTKNFRIVPHGTYFLKASPYWEPLDFDDPQFISDISKLQPVMKSQAHRVSRLEFTDPTGHHWVWDWEHGLHQENTVVS